MIWNQPKNKNKKQIKKNLTSILPASSSGFEKMTEDELEAVSGGWGCPDPKRACDPY